MARSSPLLMPAGPPGCSVVVPPVAWRTMTGRLGIFDVTPVVECGKYPAKAVVGERIPITATIVREGHQMPSANVVWRCPDGTVATGRPHHPHHSHHPGGVTVAGDTDHENRGERCDGGCGERDGHHHDRDERDDRVPLHRMTCTNPGLDTWYTELVPTCPGFWTFQIQAWVDPLGDWWRDIRIKVDAGQDAAELANDLEWGARILDRAARRVPRRRREDVLAAATRLRQTTLSVSERVAPAFDPELAELLHSYPVRELVTRSPRYRIWVDRPRALFGSWYEFFPRSEGELVDGRPTHGTFRSAMRRLPAIARMGFDVVYLPPIHPIGTTNRKGRNNSLVAGPDDPGVPWAIGSPEGGHDAVDPRLGTLADFDSFVARARELGLEVALDLAVQFSPDHPWVTEHPEWFTTRPDGTIAYAENPPKKYQDIYPPNFDNDPDGLYQALLGVVRHWMSHGVRVFRCDNPHTKPLSFWHQLIWEIKSTDPDVLFLAEAYAKPAMMYALARIGFTQSYTYFTWRNTRQELAEYGRELAARCDWFRPNFWVNTPDILHASLQYGGPPMFKIRAVLASMMSPTWGMYSGFELFEHVAVRPGSEEYLDSEKYQLRPRDWDAAEREGRSLAPFLTRLNAVRRAHPALQQLRSLHFHRVDNDAILAFSKRDAKTGDTVLVVVTVDPFNTQEATCDLDLPELGFDWHERFEVLDEMSGATYDWGQRNYVRLDPHAEPAHVFTVRRYGW